MLNQNTTISACHQAKHFAMLFGVNEQLTAESEYPVVNTAPARECFALPFFQKGSEPFKTADQKVFHVVEMPVKRHSAYVCAVNNVLHRERFESLLLD